jgi:hypothetical protein
MLGIKKISEDQVNLVPITTRWLLLLSFLVYSGVVFSQSTPDQKNRQPIKRDVWMVLIKNSMTSSCENPVNPPACLAKTQDICRKHLPAAFDQCEKTFKGQMPNEIKPDEIRHWSLQLGRCTVDNFIMLAGANGIDMTKCPTRKP